MSSRHDAIGKRAWLVGNSSTDLIGRTPLIGTHKFRQLVEDAQHNRRVAENRSHRLPACVHSPQAS